MVHASRSWGELRSRRTYEDKKKLEIGDASEQYFLLVQLWTVIVDYYLNLGHFIQIRILHKNAPRKLQKLHYKIANPIMRYAFVQFQYVPLFFSYAAMSCPSSPLVWSSFLSLCIWNLCFKLMVFLSTLIHFLININNNKNKAKPCVQPCC
jgi:hypothetical protein